MRYFIDYTPYRSCRLWVNKSIPGDQIRMLDALSHWGSFDKAGSNYYSWELDLCMLPVIDIMCKRLGWIKDDGSSF